MDKVTSDTISSLAGRDDLSVADLVALGEARRACEPIEEHLLLSGWIVTLASHVHTHGRWWASARSADGERGRREIASCETREEALARAVAWTTRNAR